MIAVRLAPGSALPSLNRATVSTLPMASVADGRDDLGEDGREPFGGLARHHFVEADHGLDVGGDETCGCEFHELGPFDRAAEAAASKGLVA